MVPYLNASREASTRISHLTKHFVDMADVAARTLSRALIFCWHGRGSRENTIHHENFRQGNIVHRENAHRENTVYRENAIKNRLFLWSFSLYLDLWPIFRKMKKKNKEISYVCVFLCYPFNIRSFSDMKGKTRSTVIAISVDEDKFLIFRPQAVEQGEDIHFKIYSWFMRSLSFHLTTLEQSC